MRNRFFLWEQGAGGPSEFQPGELVRTAGWTDLRYFAGVTQELDEMLAGAGITLLLTWHADAFDERLRDSVVILVGDEKHQAPAYAAEVRAIFKTGGTRPNPLRATLRLAPSIAWRVVVRDLRNRAWSHRQSWRHRTKERPQRARRAPMFELPMGYFSLTDTEPVPFGDRTVDVFFAGSVQTGGGFTLRPRVEARRQMADAVARARIELPGLHVDFSGSGPFGNPNDAMLEPADYSARLTGARIALCPRGNFDETFRLFEAAKAGCVIVTEPLPQRWYYRDAPVLELNRWSELPALLCRVLLDPAGLAQRSDATRRWWSGALSERAAARFMVEWLAPGLSPQDSILDE